MTFYVIHAIAEERGVDIKQEVVTVSPEVVNIGGTSAELVEGEQYTVEELLYGLMLPSGNDAANELAYWAGAFFCNSSDPRALLKAFVG
jgi:serine-type D-Ala-D-Ala carboxypeptidase (penicillin-binding protein 5/6)